jgi:hypothetical protein
MTMIRRILESVNSHTLWAFNTQQSLNPYRRDSL